MAYTETDNWYGQSSITVTETTTSNVAIWSSWIQTSNSATTTNQWCQWVTQAYYRKATKKEIAEQKRYRREQAKLLAEAEKKRLEVKQRAEKLLVEHLSDAQRATLEKHSYFDVAIGERTYRIHRGTHGNVRLLNEKGQEKTLFCVQPPGVPTEDAMLAQKLHLEANEQEFLRVANARQLLP